MQFKIHPAIGVARVGNSPSDWFYGPEAPGQPIRGPFRDDDDRLKRQGARFRIYEYDDQGHVVREVTGNDAVIDWEVRLGNRKAAGERFAAKGKRNIGVPRDKLTIESARQTISGMEQGPTRLQGVFEGSGERTDVALGDLRTDDRGRLIVLGGFGKSDSPSGAPLDSTFNNDGWYDDTSDGPVRARVVVDGVAFDAEPAWVIVGPPDFAPPIGNIVTLYDVVYDAAIDKHNFHHDPELASGQVSFTRHVWPLLRSTVDMWWVEPATTVWGHAPNSGGDFFKDSLFPDLSNNGQGSKAKRESVFARIRRPDGGGGNMPLLQPEFDTNRQPRLATYHYAIMQRWVQGDFTADWSEASNHARPFTPLEDIDLALQPFALDKASLSACVGASFYPGIEAPRILRDTLTVYEAPFRIRRNLPAGSITEGLAIPWQTDFVACSTSWWPAQRPNNVVRSGQRADWDDGVTGEEEFTETQWAQMGFVVRASSGADEFVEDERKL